MPGSDPGADDAGGILRPDGTGHVFPRAAEPVLATKRARIVRFDHVGIPTTGRFEGEIPLPHLQVTCSDHQGNPFGIQWMRYWEGAPYPELVRTVAHVAFEVDDLDFALQGLDVIIEPNSPSPGVVVAFVQIDGAPVELMQIDHEQRPDL